MSAPTSLRAVVPMMVMPPVDSSYTERPQVLHTVMRWSDTDPWTVAVAFGQGTGAQVWTAGVETLRDGCTRPAGFGDLTFAPCGVPGYSDLVLTSPAGTATLRVRVRDLQTRLLDGVVDEHFLVDDDGELVSTSTWLDTADMELAEFAPRFLGGDR